MPKGIVSAALSGVASLVLFSSVVMLAVNTSSRFGGSIASKSENSGGSSSDADDQQMTQIIQAYMNAGQKNKPGEGARVVVQAKGTPGVLSAITQDYRHREWFTGFGPPRLNKRQCEGSECQTWGTIYYPEGGSAYRDFSAVLVKTPQGWRLKEFIIAPDLTQ